MIELVGLRIWAIPYVAGLASPPRKLACGMIVGEIIGPARGQTPPDLPWQFELPDRPGQFASFSGLFLIGPGQAAAVYGAVAEKLG